MCVLQGDGPGESKIKIFIQNNNLCILIISFIPISNLSKDVDVFPSRSGAEIRETHYSICHGLYSHMPSIEMAQEKISRLTISWGPRHHKLTELIKIYSKNNRPAHYFSWNSSQNQQQKKMTQRCQDGSHSLLHFMPIISPYMTNRHQLSTPDLYFKYLGFQTKKNTSYHKNTPTGCHCMRNPFRLPANKFGLSLQNFYRVEM